MSKQKPVRYDHFRNLVLKALEKHDMYYVTREQFVEWSEIVGKVKVQKETIWARFERLRPGQYKAPKDKPRVWNTMEKKFWDRRERDRQLTTLHAVMEDLVKEGILTRYDRIRYKTKYIQWHRRSPKSGNTND